MFDVGLDGVDLRVVRPGYGFEAAVAGLGAGFLASSCVVGGAVPGFGFMLAAFGVAAFGLALYGVSVTRRARRAVDCVLSRGVLDGARLVPGFYVVFYASIGRQTYIGSRFVSMGESVTMAREAWRALRGRGFVVTGKYGDVFVAVPALMVEDCGAVVAAVAPMFAVDTRSVELEACRGEACAQARVGLRGGQVEWSLTYYPGGGARAARLLLTIQPVTPAVPGWMEHDQARAARMAARSVVLAEAREPGSYEGRLGLVPRGAWAVVAPPGVTSSVIARAVYRHLSGSLGAVGSPPAAVLRARLVLDIPWRPDVAEEKALEPA